MEKMHNLAEEILKYRGTKEKASFSRYISVESTIHIDPPCIKYNCH